ncbi:MAG: hypothetical protein JWM44_2460 [Bacilli bacterium]|nr:hypothetical protein [Bacilli bacterium]
MNEKLARLAKWKLHRFYAKSPEIVKHLPQTAFFTPSSFSSFMNKYNSVYIKANTQHTGKGIIKVWKTVNGYQFVKVRGKANFSPSTKDLYNKIKKISPNQSFIIQKTIDLAQIKRRFFDIRVMMMRDGNRKWEYAGMIAKVSGHGSVVSNLSSGKGYATTIEEALIKSLKFNKMQIESIKKRLISLSYKIIHYSEKYPFYSFQSGIDLAVDKKGRIWIIEINLHNPSHSLFKKLKDKTYFRKISRLYSAYRKHNKRLI